MWRCSCLGISDIWGWMSLPQKVRALLDVTAGLYSLSDNLGLCPRCDNQNNLVSIAKHPKRGDVTSLKTAAPLRWVRWSCWLPNAPLTLYVSAPPLMQFPRLLPALLPPAPLARPPPRQSLTHISYKKCMALIYSASLLPLGHLYWMTLMCLNGRVSCLPRCVEPWPFLLCPVKSQRLDVNQPAIQAEPARLSGFLHGGHSSELLTLKYRALDCHLQGACHLERACSKPVTTLLEPCSETCAKAFTFYVLLTPLS